MTTVTTKEFNTNQRKYFNLAVNEQVCIKRGKSKFFLMHDNDDDAELLALAESRMNDEFTSGEEYKKFLNNLINETYSSKKSL